MSNLSPNTQAELILTVLSGPDKGAVYKLVSSRVKIGRATDNDITINDPRCSRHHAEVELTPSGITIRDVSSQGGMDVDGNTTREAILKTGSHVTLGATILRFEVRSANALAPAPQGLGSVPSAPSNSPNNYGYAAPAKKGNFNLIVGIIVIAVIALVIGTEEKAKKELEIRTDDQIDEDIKASKERIQAIEKEQEKKGINSLEYKEVQGFFTQGFRDYREGNFGRAIQAFDNALALRPDYELARKYRDLSARRKDELIQLTMLEAKRYMEQGKYQAARTAYQQVMILIGDPKNKQYLEAQEYFNESELYLKGAY